MWCCSPKKSKSDAEFEGRRPSGRRKADCASGAQHARTQFAPSAQHVVDRPIDVCRFERLVTTALKHRLRRPPHQLLDERRAYAADATRGFLCELVFDAQHAGVTPDEQPALGFSGQADFYRLIHAAGPHRQRRFQHFRPVGGKHE